MIFRRKIYDRLLEWKRQSDGATALLIEGARRVGKSSIVEEFAKREYETYILIDFNRPKEGVVDAIVNRPDDLDGLFNLLMVSYGRACPVRNCEGFATASLASQPIIGRISVFHRPSFVMETTKTTFKNNLVLRAHLEHSYFQNRYNL